jgi:hypothetical protein
MKLSDKALLVQLNVSQWTARKLDRKATEQVAKNNNTSLSAGRYNKSLLPMNDYLANVHQKTTLIRKKYYANTLPWGIEGTQMLPSANYLAFMNEFRKEKGDWESLVSKFYDEYPRLRTDAERFLGDLYNKADYPPLHELQRKFKIDLAVFPVPADDFRVEISDHELSRIQQDVEDRVQNAAKTAMDEAWQRLFDRVKHMAEKLADPKAVFRDTLVENTKDVCSILSRLNFTDDPDLEAMRQEVEQSLANNHPEALRNNPDLRRDKAAEASDIMKRMGAFMGVTNDTNGDS